MAASNGLKPIESGATGFQKLVTTTSSNLNGNKLLYTYANKNELTTPYGNLFRSFNFPITNEEIQKFSSEYNGTALSYLNVDEIIVIEIPKGEYGELIDGKTFQLTLPVTLNSVETATTVYGTYFGYLGRSANNFIGGRNLNAQYSEKNKNYFGFDPSEQNEYNTNVTFLYCNDVTDGRPQNKGDEVTVLTATTINLLNSQGNPYTLSTVTFSSYESVLVEITSSSNLSDLVVEVDGFKINTPNSTPGNATWVTINKENVSSVNPIIYQLGNTTTPKELTITIKQRFTGALEWDAFSPTNKFSNFENDETKKLYATFDGIRLNGSFVPNTYDKPVGILYQDKGFAVITDSELVQGFRYSAGTSSGFNGIPSGNTYNGDINFAKIYFSTIGESNSQFQSITTEFIQNIVCIASAGEFVSTTNTTFKDAYSENAEKPVFITSIGLYNAAGELIGIGKLSEPVKKLPNTIVPFNIRLVI